MTRMSSQKLFLDANLLFTSPYALEEARRNLALKYPAAVQSLHSIAASLELQDHRSDLDFPEGLAAKDQPIFQAALACGADFLLTGDRGDFGLLMHCPQRTFGVHVTTVADFLELQLAAGSEDANRPR